MSFFLPLSVRILLWFSFPFFFSPPLSLHLPNLLSTQYSSWKTSESQDYKSLSNCVVLSKFNLTCLFYISKDETDHLILYLVNLVILFIYEDFPSSNICLFIRQSQSSFCSSFSYKKSGNSPVFLLSLFDTLIQPLLVTFTRIGAIMIGVLILASIVSFIASSRSAKKSLKIHR